MSSPVVVYELLQKSGAQLLICDPSFTSVLELSPVPVTTSTSDIFDSSKVMATAQIEPIWTAETDEDVVVIYHTSGSTSGSPKLVAAMAGWFDFLIEKSESTGTGMQSIGQQKTMTNM
jgi:long-subunit acyl-CoA synthetase (AMP-forming)